MLNIIKEPSDKKDELFLSVMEDIPEGYTPTNIVITKLLSISQTFNIYVSLKDNKLSVMFFTKEYDGFPFLNKNIVKNKEYTFTLYSNETDNIVVIK